MTYTCGWCEWSGEDLAEARVHLLMVHPEPVKWYRAALGGKDPAALVGSGVWFWLQDQAGDGWQPATVTGWGAKDGQPVVDVTLANGWTRWGWLWQVRPRAAGEPPFSDRPQELWRAEDVGAVVHAARALLHRLDHMTTEEFSRGGEREAREQLRQTLGRLLEVEL